MKQFLLFLTIYLFGLGTGVNTTIFKPIGVSQLLSGKNQFDQYLCNDIAHIDLDKLQISFEVDTVIYKYDNKQEIYDFIEKSSAYNSCTIGYKDDLDYNIRNGYIYARTVYNEDKQYTELIYSGPNWTIDAQQDTTYLISTFNNVEKLYDPNTKTTWYESYTVD